MLKKNDTLKLEINDITNLGFGVGKHDGQVIFVNDAVPGDFVETKIIKITSSYAVGKLEKLIRPSEKRCDGRCDNKLCHACPYKNLSYEEELILKTESVKAIFKKAGLSEFEILDTIKTASTLSDFTLPKLTVSLPLSIALLQSRDSQKFF